LFLAPWFPTLRRHGLTPRQVFTWRRQARERAATCRYRRAQPRCLINSDDPVPIAVRLSASAIVRAAISNVATIAVGKALGCLHFDANDARRQVWNGKWPGEDDCERLGFFVNGSLDFPDLNRLFTDCVWDADTGRWERKQ
jgi:hypothetical protein